MRKFSNLVLVVLGLMGSIFSVESCFARAIIDSCGIVTYVGRSPEGKSGTTVVINDKIYQIATEANGATASDFQRDLAILLQSFALKTPVCWAMDGSDGDVIYALSIGKYRPSASQ